MTREKIIAAIKEYAQELGRAPSFRELSIRVHVRKTKIKRCFGTYGAALRAAGMDRVRGRHPARLEHLFAEWAGVARKLGKLPTIYEHETHSTRSLRPLVRRFGGWKRVPKGMLGYAEREGLAEEWPDVVEMIRTRVEDEYEEVTVAKRTKNGAGELAETDLGKVGGKAAGKDKAAGSGVGMTAGKGMGKGADKAAGRHPGKVANEVVGKAAERQAMERASGKAHGLLPAQASRQADWPVLDGPMYGPPMMLMPGSAMVYGPSNEAGVLFLFATMAWELGFAVTRIQSEFPDCEAMRRIKDHLWQRVRIEFEYESRNFVRHLHPLDGCEVIVCWIHNWPECPLEVIELSGKVKQLPEFVSSP